MSPNDALKLIRDYIKRVDAKFRQGNATEHSYREDLGWLMRELLGSSFTVTNEPKRTECGAPDYVITRQNLPVAYIEAKDVGKLDFKDRGIKEQLARYQEGLPTLVATDYLEFHLFVGGEPKDSVRIGHVGAKGIAVAGEEELNRFLALIITSIEGAKPETITSPKRLALRMAGATRLLADAIAKSLNATPAGGSIINPMVDLKENLRRTLKHNLRNEEFADLYAQTIAYGLFIARYQDNSGHFTVGRAGELLRTSTKLLFQLFREIDTNREAAFAWIIEQLTLLLAHTDTHAILEAYQLERGDHDPTFHLYEDFLEAYDPDKRKKLGVYYTPLPVVRFIVRAVDSLLQKEFNLSNGLADTATFPEDEKKYRVQILDPATGTGTFLAEVVRLVHKTIKDKGLGGMWQSYVEQCLLPRLHGFELMMAPYAIATLKLGLQLRESGYERAPEAQIRIRLANSLEEGAGETGGRWWLAEEAKEAIAIQRNTPVMVLLGNPPYSRSSQNKGRAITDLLRDYKLEPGENPTAKREDRKPLAEKNITPLSDDYVKFIRIAQHYVERNGTGIVAFITSHTFLDAPTLRGMRWHLLQTFDRIYTIDLHGNQRRGETREGDKNVFNVQTGVAITLFIRYNPKRRALGQLFHYDLRGSQREKFDWLNLQTLDSIKWQKLSPKPPYYLFFPVDNTHTEEYAKGFALDRLFGLSSSGIKTHQDNFAIAPTKEELTRRIEDLIKLPDEALRSKYAISENADWTLERARADVKASFETKRIVPYLYRPFDSQYTFFSGQCRGFIVRPRLLSSHIINGQNVAVILSAQTNRSTYHHAFCTNRLCDMSSVSGGGREGCHVFPLYVLRQEALSDRGGASTPFNAREDFVPNFREEVYRDICKRLGEEVEPQSLFDYIYATLHCPTYRECYKEQLSIGFPRIPYPIDPKRFHRLAELGARLRQLHLMEETAEAATYPVSGDNALEKAQWRIEDGEGRVYINATQYFGGITESMWSYPVGSYRPMQKWLNDRKGSRLDWDGIRHYMRMAHAIRETLTLMAEIDTVWAPPA